MASRKLSSDDIYDLRKLYSTDADKTHDICGFVINCLLVVTFHTPTKTLAVLVGMYKCRNKRCKLKGTGVSTVILSLCRYENNAGFFSIVSLLSVRISSDNGNRSLSEISPKTKLTNSSKLIAQYGTTSFLSDSSSCVILKTLALLLKVFPYSP